LCTVRQPYVIKCSFCTSYKALSCLCIHKEHTQYMYNRVYMYVVYKYKYVHATTLEDAAPTVFMFCLTVCVVPCYLTSNCI